MATLIFLPTSTPASLITLKPRRGLPLFGWLRHNLCRRCFYFLADISEFGHHEPSHSRSLRSHNSLAVAIAGEQYRHEWAETQACQLERFVLLRCCLNDLVGPLEEIHHLSMASGLRPIMRNSKATSLELNALRRGATNAGEESAELRVLGLESTSHFFKSRPLICRDESCWLLEHLSCGWGVLICSALSATPSCLLDSHVRTRVTHITHTTSGHEVKVRMFFFKRGGIFIILSVLYEVHARVNPTPRRC